METKERKAFLCNPKETVKGLYSTKTRYQIQTTLGL